MFLTLLLNKIFKTDCNFPVTLLQSNGHDEHFCTYYEIVVLYQTKTFFSLVRLVHLTSAFELKKNLTLSLTKH